jgi:hypothetical protein
LLIQTSPTPVTFHSSLPPPGKGGPGRDPSRRKAWAPPLRIIVEEEKKVAGAAAEKRKTTAAPACGKSCREIQKLAALFLMFAIRYVHQFFEVRLLQRGPFCES